MADCPRSQNSSKELRVGIFLSGLKSFSTSSQLPIYSLRLFEFFPPSGDFLFPSMKVSLQYLQLNFG